MDAGIAARPCIEDGDRSGDIVAALSGYRRRAVAPDG
jgi:hypothetical protein